MKWNVYRCIALILLVALSVGFGLAYDGIATAIERKLYPRETDVTALIESNAALYSIPEPVLFATVRTQSRFVSNAVSEDGRIGLMQLSPETFSFICTELLGKPNTESGMLYDPATNLEAGSAYLSYLYDRYGVWETVYAAYCVGTDSVDAWLATPELLTDHGTLVKIPDQTAASYVKKVQHAEELYQTLYDFT